MRGWVRSRSRSRSEWIAHDALVLGLALALAGCGTQPTTPQPVARVGGVALDAAVVEHVAARDGLSPDDARARAVDTLRLVAAGHEQHDGSRDPAASEGLAPRRAEHLRRAARARLWLSERFEPEHRPQDIPDDEPRLVRARQDPRLVHPEIYVACQVVAQPPDVESLDAKAAITGVLEWRAAAERALEPVRARIERNVPVGDSEACSLIEREVELSGPAEDPRVEVSFERAAGFDLDACAEQDAAGACTQPRFDPAWTDRVRALAGVGFSSPFFTRFGLHLVYVEQRLPAQPAGDPATEQRVRESVLDAWRAEAFALELEALGGARTVRMVLVEDDAR